jgi:hypothetical protein
MERKVTIKILQYLKGLRGANILLTDDGNCLVLIGNHNTPYSEKEMLFINKKVLEILNEDNPKKLLYTSPANNPTIIQASTGIKVFEILGGMFWKSGYKNKIGWFGYYEDSHTYLTPAFSVIEIKELKLKLQLYTRNKPTFLNHFL